MEGNLLMGTKEREPEGQEFSLLLLNRCSKQSDLIFVVHEIHYILRSFG
jgi:hypothetical protein